MQRGQYCPETGPRDGWSADKAADALFLLGYALHAVEDVAVHRGRTDAEHSCNIAIDRSPDEDKQAINHAVSLARDFLKELPDQFGGDWSKLANYRGKNKLPKSDKERVLGSSWDISLPAYFEFTKMGQVFLNRPDRDKHQVRWCPPGGCFNAVQAVFQNSVKIPMETCEPSKLYPCGCKEAGR
jgi:hypothetical protein